MECNTNSDPRCPFSPPNLGSEEAPDGKADGILDLALKARSAAALLGFSWEEWISKDSSRSPLGVLAFRVFREEGFRGFEV